MANTELEELQKRYRASLDQAQNDFIDKIYNDVEWLCEKANRKNYEPTQHERDTFGQIYTIIANMNKWF